MEPARRDRNDPRAAGRHRLHVLSRRRGERPHVGLPARRRRRAGGARPVVPARPARNGSSEVAAMAAVSALLETKALSKHFGGLNAVNEVDLSVAPGARGRGRLGARPRHQPGARRGPRPENTPPGQFTADETRDEIMRLIFSTRE